MTNGPSIDYIAKDYSSVEESLINFANTNFGPRSGIGTTRLWTNFSQSNFGRNYIQLVAYVADLLFYYMDNQASETYLQTAQLDSSIKKIAKQFGFTPATATSASGLATFTFTASGTIPRGFRVSSLNGEEFFLTNSLTAPSAGSFSANVLQGTLVTDVFTATGLQNEEFDLSSLGIVRDLTNTNPLDISPQVRVNNNLYQLVDSFISYDGSDTFPSASSTGGRVYTLEDRADGTHYIRFGDGIFGRQLQPGEVIQVIYRIGGGSIGNIPEQSLITLVDTSAVVSAVTNNAPFSGGADEQSIEQLRQLIPASLRTLDRAVAVRDYADLLKVAFPEVFTANAEINQIDPGIDLDIYVIPQGVGITKITDNPGLRNNLINYLDERKTVTIQFQIIDAFSIDMLFSFEVFLEDTASRTVVTQSIQEALNEFFSLTIGSIDGDGIGFAEDILLKDITTIVENISGVRRLETKRQTYRPRIDYKPVSSLTTYNNTEVKLFTNIQEREWFNVAAGTDTTTDGVVIYDNSSPFIYDYDTGVVQYTNLVDLSKVSPGDRFRFKLRESTELSIDDVSLITSGDYFDFYKTSGQVRVWFNVDSGGGAPSNPGTLIEVAISATDSESDVAQDVFNALTSDAELFVRQAGTSVIIQVLDSGNKTDSTVTGSGFSVSVDSGSSSFAEFAVLAVDDVNDNLTILAEQRVAYINTVDGEGDVQTAELDFDKFLVFKRLVANVTNLGAFSLTDSSLDLSVVEGTGVQFGGKTLLDNDNVFIPNQYSTGQFLLVDSNANVWEIASNNENTITVGISALNDGSVTSVVPGAYSIVENFIGKELLFNGSRNNIQYNTKNTFFVPTNASLNVLGTINDPFIVSELQSNFGVIGKSLDLLSFDSGTGLVRLNGSPDLTGVSGEYILVDNAGSQFKIKGINNIANAAVQYTAVSTDFRKLSSSGTDLIFAQGFQVEEADVFPTASFNLRRSGNIGGSLLVRVVADLAGLPDLSNVIASSFTVASNTISKESAGTKSLFEFITQPSLSVGTQYHLVISTDPTYTTTFKDDVELIADDTEYDNPVLVSPGVYLISYTNPVNLLSVLPQNFFTDSSGETFEILSVDDVNDSITVSAPSLVPSNYSAGSGGRIFANDFIEVKIDNVGTYTNGVASSYNGVVWTAEPLKDFIFSIEGPKSLTIDVQGSVSLGSGAFVGKRYYDDQNQLSYIVGLTSGIIKGASDVNAYGVGTVDSQPNSRVDQFTFRTSRFVDDIVNLRASEIPQFKVSDLQLKLFGGVL